jgi:hypothetical protein
MFTRNSRLLKALSGTAFFCWLDVTGRAFPQNPPDLQDPLGGFKSTERLLKISKRTVLIPAIATTL